MAKPIKILFVSHMNPMSASFGAEQRTNIIFNAFRQLGANIDIAYLGDNPIISDAGMSGKVYDLSSIEKRFSKGANIRRLLLLNMFPKSQGWAEGVGELIEANQYDYIFCRYLPYAALCGLKRYGNRLLLDIDDMPEQALQIDFASKKGLKRLYFKVLRYAYGRDTKHWISKCKCCFVPNKAQAVKFNVDYLPNISSFWSKDNSSSNHVLLFVGKLDWKPNKEGIIRFLQNCWSVIKDSIPDASLLVAGKGFSETEKNEIENKYRDVNILGFVEDLTDFYKNGNIVICPIYSGAGTNIKIVEALSMSKALITSKESVKGYEDFLKDGLNCMIASSDDEFAHKTIYLLEHESMIKKISQKGHEDALAQYSFDSIVNILKSHIEP